MKHKNRLFFKNKLMKITFGVSLGVIGITAIVAGYVGSYKANPYRKYYRRVVNDTPQSVVASYRSAIENGAQLLILPGFTSYDPMLLALKNPAFNKTGFVLIDEKLSNNDPSNPNAKEDKDKDTSQVSTIQFRTDEGSFITGIALAQYLNDYKEYFKKDDNKLTWGTYGGKNFSSVTSYMGGLQQGIKFFNESIVPKDATLEKIEQVFLGDKYQDNFADSFASDGGNAITDLFLQKNIDCLIPVAGPQAISLAAKIASKKTKRTIILGVDVPLEDNKVIKDYQLPSDKNMPSSIVPFSSLKNISQITPKVLTAINEGRNYEVDAKGVGGFGINTLGTILNEGVGVSEAGKKYFTKAINTFKNNSLDYTQALNQIQQEAAFKKLSTKEGLVYVAGNEQFTYPNLPIQSSIYNRNPIKKPDNYNMTQKEWEEKTNFNLTNFIKRNVQSDDNKIKIIVTPSTAVLLDNSFNQTSYLALYLFFKSYNINIPNVK